MKHKICLCCFYFLEFIADTHFISINNIYLIHFMSYCQYLKKKEISQISNLHQHAMGHHGGQILYAMDTRTALTTVTRKCAIVLRIYLSNVIATSLMMAVQ